jgi:hypothetical protein
MREQGEPLWALLRVITEQVNIVEQDITQLYDNWFIETCEDWVVPYLGDLIGYQPVVEAGLPSDSATAQGRLRNKVLIPRREIANTLRYRRQKGSLALLENLANDVTGWTTRAVEFYTLLAWTQQINHLRLNQGRTVDLRDGHALQHLGGAFDELAYSVDIRSLNSCCTPGRYNLAAVGLFVWRLQPYSVTNTSACCIEDFAPHCYTFSALGNDTPLFNKPVPENDASAIARELNAPAPIRRRAFDEEKANDPVYYGVDKSFAIWVEGWPDKASTGMQLVHRDWIICADLTDWHYKSPKGKLCVDPILGRMVFPSKQLPKKVSVSYHYGFSADMGVGNMLVPYHNPKTAKLLLSVGKSNCIKN